MRNGPPGLVNRHRDKDGEISRKHGNTTVRTLRAIYGSAFATGFAPSAMLKEVLDSTGMTSLSQLHREQLHKDNDDGVLETRPPYTQQNAPRSPSNPEDPSRRPTAKVNLPTLPESQPYGDATF